MSFKGLHNVFEKFFRFSLLRRDGINMIEIWLHKLRLLIEPIRNENIYKASANYSTEFMRIETVSNRIGDKRNGMTYQKKALASGVTSSNFWLVLA